MWPVTLSRFDSTSPKTAPLQWPICKGPVGFAETYSTFMFLFRPISSLVSLRAVSIKSSSNFSFLPPGNEIWFEWTPS